MLIISREASIKIRNHAWNVFPLEAFGFLLGSESYEAIYAALPCSNTRCLNKFDDRWIGIYENFEKAYSVGKLFNLNIVGFYASTNIYCNRDDYPMPQFLESSSIKIILLYQALCCPQCSRLASCKYNNRWLKLGENYDLSQGKRIDDSINQKKILKEWHKTYGTESYSNQSRVTKEQAR